MVCDLVNGYPPPDMAAKRDALDVAHLAALAERRGEESAEQGRYGDAAYFFAVAIFLRDCVESARPKFRTRRSQARNG